MSYLPPEADPDGSLGKIANKYLFVVSQKIFDVEKLNLFDGDIILSRENVDAFLAAFYPSPELQYEAVEAARDYKRQLTRVRLRRKAVADRSLTWDNAMVPFSIDDRRTSMLL